MVRSLNKIKKDVPLIGLEIDSIMSELSTHSDREAAIVSHSLLDDAIGAAIRANFVDLTDGEASSLFEGSGPISSFSAKIKIGYAMGLFSTPVVSALETVNTIRNFFAHTILPVSFSHPGLVEACQKLMSLEALEAEIIRIANSQDLTTHHGESEYNYYLLDVDDNIGARVKLNTGNSAKDLYLNNTKQLWFVFILQALQKGFGLPEGSQKL